MSFHCHVCGSDQTTPIVRLGNIPPVNAFLTPAEVSQEKAYPLNLSYCRVCSLAQLEEIVPPDRLFTQYLHLSSGSASNIKHLEDVAALLTKQLKIDDKTKILEIGSNDGTLLSKFKPTTKHLLGVDPAKNLVEMNREKGVEQIATFFNTTVAAGLQKSHGAFDVIVALNVVPHTPEVVDLLKGVRTVLSKTGTFVMEGAYALATILKGEFDTIYHEHVYCFSLHSLQFAMKKAGLTLIDVERIPEQGGSLRAYAVRDDVSGAPSKRVTDLLAEEKKLGLTDAATYEAIPPKVEKFKKELRALVETEKKAGRKVIGLGAPARGVVILNYCGLGEGDLIHLIDDTPLKHGRLTPGVHIPVKSWEAEKLGPQHSFLLLSWNYRDHMLKKLRQHAPGARVIVPFPALEMVSLD